MTSATRKGNPGGLTGADSLCQSLANAANRPGSYLAWISDSSGSPATRFTRATVPYIRVDGEVIAQDWDNLTDGSLLNRAINLTEIGVGGASSPNEVWTSTGANGQQQVNPDNCDDWTNGTSSLIGDYGLKSSIAPRWTAYVTSICNQELRLYCFQQR